MTKQEIEDVLIEKIKENHALTTGEEPDIDGNTAPFKDLDFFDSLLASEVGIDLQDEIDCDFDNVKEAFKEAQLEGITIEQMADIILKVEEA
ncbi:hypothetical protein [Fodinibius salsisoli]|uniref:Carrier domain-containing protein n=1 Tax=Fodinibius salsisoli TaxID=2820877 RepID=A0ABT3PSM9_9BACT|nr:hypothetical protein [Fodinibius salsisoli]MCW9708842.1 hypothetical protein [Fodinibius salsisoli]